MNIFNRIFDADSGQSGGQYYIIGRVKKIVLGPTIGGKFNLPEVDYLGPQDVGKIRYEILYSTLTTSKAETAFEPAYPIFSFIKQYPVIGEIVFIIPGPTYRLNERSSKKQFFYFPPYSIWGNANHGAFPNASELSDFLNNYNNKPNYSGKSSFIPKFPLGKTFKEKLVRTLKPFEGDSIIQSRFGQSIRLGSTVTDKKNQNTWSNSGINGDPITIILNEQKQSAVAGLDQFDPFIENINKDGSSIWLTSTQEVNLTNLGQFPLGSFGISINKQTDIVLEIERLPINNDFIDASTQDNNNASIYNPPSSTTSNNTDSTSNKNSSFIYTAKGKQYLLKDSFKIEIEVNNNETGELITVQGSSSLISIQDAYNKVVVLLNDYKNTQNINFQIPSIDSLEVYKSNF